MDLPPVTSPLWEDVICGRHDVTFEFLAIKIFLGMARVRHQKAPNSLPALAFDLRTLFERNSQLPSAQRDLAKLRG